MGGENGTDKPVIRVKDLYKIYRIGTNKVRALNGVDFAVGRGEFCCIVGTSGSGKSTLLNMMAGLEKPTKGQVVIAGEHIEKKNESQLVQFRQEHVGFIFQSYNLMPNMTAIENVALPLVFRGVDKTIREKKAIRMLKLVGLGKYLLHRPGQMSGGQQQRVGIARALVVNPEIVFADEPTGNLDSNTTMEVLQLIQKIVHEKQQTMVMVTHDNYLATFGDRVIHIRDGKILKIEDHRTGMVVNGTGEILVPANGGNPVPTGQTIEVVTTATPMQGAVQPQGTVSVQETEIRQGTEPMQGSVPLQGSTPMQGVVPLQGTVPIQGVVQPQGIVPVQGTVIPQGTVPVQGSVPPQGTVPMQGAVQPQGIVPVQGMVISQGTERMQGAIPPQETTPMQGIVPPQGTVMSQDTMPTQEVAMQGTQMAQGAPPLRGFAPKGQSVTKVQEFSQSAATSVNTQN